MDKVFRYLPTHILICVIVGIGIQIKLSLWKFGFYKLFILLGSLILITIVLHLFVKKHLFIISSSACYILLGFSVTYISSSKNYNHYYRNHLDSHSLLTIKIVEELKSNAYNYRYIGNVLKVNKQEVFGKVILNINKNLDIQELVVGNCLITKSELKEIQPPKNPNSFNYKRYLQLRDIEAQLFLNKNEFKITSNSVYNLTASLYELKKNIQFLLQKNFSHDVYSIINSLLLGERKSASKELINSYANAGAIHILAISGLHIGILVIILNTIFSPLLYLKHGKSIKLILLISFLWAFAMFTGLSASVVRAVTMFSFMILGNSIKHKQPIEHSLISSMLLLLLIKPQFLFDVGFQLSYLAVFSIVKLQPLFLKLWTPENLILNKIWKLSTVSVAAQFGVLPLSLYYFHQFPTLFIISNLFIIPWLGIILSFGIVIILLGSFNFLPKYVVEIYELMIRFMNSIVNWISHQEEFIIGNIFISKIEMIIWYILMILIFVLLRRISSKKILLFLAAIILFQCYYINIDYHNYNKKELVVFHKSKKSIFGIREHGSIKLYSDLTKSQLEKDYNLSNYTFNEKVTIEKDNTTNRIGVLGNQLILSIDSLGVYPKNFKKRAIILLKYSPKLNLNRLIKTLEPTIIIADGSNYKSYINRWQKTCDKQKTPFHSTQQNGAYILKY
ncbi:ComEC/Rec2 family competence protein [Tenacibaculum sp. MEBiC06402]|uniref:ComEC/Rec2 family competence protein n=1 Tax=unclassified Tenacibaculum TaxID=2635139 RepID=UPI003B9B6228